MVFAPLARVQSQFESAWSYGNNSAGSAVQEPDDQSSEISNVSEIHPKVWQPVGSSWLAYDGSSLPPLHDKQMPDSKMSSVT